MGTLFLILVVVAIAAAAWVTLGKKKKVTPKISSGGVTSSDPVDQTKPTINNKL